MTQRSSICKIKQLLKVLLVAFFCAYTSYAFACSCFFLQFGFIGPYSSRLPANAIGIPWFVSNKLARKPWNEDYFVADEQRFALEFLDAGEFRRIPYRIVMAQEFDTQFDTYLIYHIVPKDDGLQPGATYRVTDLLDPESYGEAVDDRQVVVEVDHEELPVDTALTLYIGSAKRDNLRIAANAQCSGGLAMSQVNVAARLPGQFQKWEDQLLFRTIVDGKQWDARSSWCSQIEPGRSWTDVAHDRVFVACETPDFFPIVPVLESGVHTVSMEARLPGTDIVLKTETKTMELTCER